MSELYISKKAIEAANEAKEVAKEMKEVAIKGLEVAKDENLNPVAKEIKSASCAHFCQETRTNSSMGAHNWSL